LSADTNAVTSHRTLSTKEIIEMTRRKSILGALVLCALSLSAFAATSASAEGLTAFVCTKAAGTPQYSDSHCLTESVGGEYATIAVTGATPATGEAVGTSKLVGTVALAKVEVNCTAMMTTSGTVENVVGPPMKAVGANTVLQYSGCEANLVANPTKKCNIEPITGGPTGIGTINTTALKSSTSFNATEHFVTFEPEVPTLFTEFKIIQKTPPTECPAALVGQVVKVSGSARGVVPAALHSHLTFSGTAGGNLKVGGAAAEYEGTNRVTMHTVGPPTVSETIGLKTS
jgi:hypothetical protein